MYSLDGWIWVGNPVFITECRLKTSQELKTGRSQVTYLRKAALADLAWEMNMVRLLRNAIAAYDRTEIRTGTVGFCSLPNSIAHPFRRSYPSNTGVADNPIVGQAKPT